MVGLEESLTKAFSIAARKPPHSRKDFDRAVLAQLQADYAQRVAELGVVVEAAAPGAADRAAAANKAAAAFDEARQCMEISATALRERELERHEAEAKVSSAVEAE